jgi:hypothetical protein
VCTENLVRIDLLTEWHNVDGDDRPAMLPIEAASLPFKSPGRPEAENAALRQQVIVLQRKMRGRVDFTASATTCTAPRTRWRAHSLSH